MKIATLSISMKKKMRPLPWFSGFLICIVLTGVVGYFSWHRPIFKNITPSSAAKLLIPDSAIELNTSHFKKLTLQVATLKKYSKEKNYSATHCFLIDMSIPSGKKRFFIYNLQTDSVEVAGLVTHGSGSITGSNSLYFSNVPGSGCTSLGKYKIGNAYNGRFGLAYKLHGLDKTNNRAFERFVVLHAHECVPVEEIYPLNICPSLGCPTVSPEFLHSLKKHLDKTSKPILLHIYE